MIKFIDPPNPETELHSYIPGTYQKYSTVELSLDKLDEVLKKDKYAYAGIGGLDRKEDRITRIKQKLDNNMVIHKPILDAISGDVERFKIVSGRHRIAAIKEKGISTCLFIVPKKLAEDFVSRFGHDD